ncbi:hypothetical protein DICA4_E15852 [Diutina catenulata]
MKGLLTVAAVITAATAKVAVYELDKPATAEPLAVSDHIAEVYLADKFGAGDAVAVQNAKAAEFLNEHHAVRGNKPQLVVSVGGVASPEQFLDQAPTFTALHEVAEPLERALESVYRKKSVSDAVSVFSTTGASALAHQFAGFDRKMANTWRQFVDGSHEQVVLASDPSQSQLIADKLYMSELSQLLHLKAATPASANEVVVVDLGSLSSLANRMGPAASTVSYAADVLKELVSQFADYAVTVVVSDDDVMGTKPSHYSKRAANAARAFNVEVRAPSGWDSENDCRKATGDCSGHGSCVETRGTWKCACVPSFDKKAQKTSKWAGPDCSKRDVSGEANLFLWTGIGIFSIVAFGIKLLASVGNQPLPGVLQAATESKKTN